MDQAWFASSGCLLLFKGFPDSFRAPALLGRVRTSVVGT